ncbi:hypothetical protein K501DRAFT_228024 [Backusella circina FSU 941]|nr:hypothetical protein K501DRAFT_228024 [Backusella circina FSU 941]
MGILDHFSSHKEEVENTSDEHKAKLSHEVIAGAATYEAMKAYNEHCEKNGKPNNHAKAMEIFSGFAGVALDRLIETKGLDFIDKQKAKRHAEQEAQKAYEEYGI